MNILLTVGLNCTAFAELLDNSLDEEPKLASLLPKVKNHHIIIFIFSFFFSSFNWQVCNGATYIYVDVLKNKKDGSKMLQVEGRPVALLFCLLFNYCFLSGDFFTYCPCLNQQISDVNILFFARGFCTYVLQIMVVE